MSSPPAPARSPLPALRIERARFRADWRVGEALCFAAEGAPPGASTAVEQPHGGLSLLTELVGTVAATADDHLELDVPGGLRVRVRHLIPRSIDLRPLVTRRVRIELRYELFPGRPPTADARLYAMTDEPLRRVDGKPTGVFMKSRGDLVLWARDGALPTDAPLELSVRMAHDARGNPRLVVASKQELATVPAPEIGRLSIEGSAFTVGALRVTDESSAFVLLRG